MGEIQLGLYRLDGYSWGELPDPAREQLPTTFALSPLGGRPGRQYVLPNPQLLGRVVWGRFAHQTSEALTDYRSTPQGLEVVPGETLTFEHYWYVVSFDAQVVLLQQRRLPPTKDLTNREVARDLEEILSQSAISITGRLLSLSSFEEDLGESEVRDLLSLGRVLRLRVDGLAGKRVPDDVDLTNPRPDANGVLHEYTNHDFSHGVAEVMIKADDRNPRANVADSFYAKAAIASGSVVEVESDVDGRIERRVRQLRRATIGADEPLTREAVLILLDRVRRGDYTVAVEPRQGTLFGSRGIAD